MAQHSLLEYQSIKPLRNSAKNEQIKKKYAVLVIDDQENWRELLCEILEIDFDVTLAQNYENAVAAIRRQKRQFHVVVTDMRLEDGEPGNQDGLRLAEYLRNEEEHTKTIIVTGYPTIATTKQAISEFSVYDYIEKHPSDGSMFDFHQFHNTVRRAAQEAEASRARAKQAIKYLSVSLGSPDQQDLSLSR